LTAHISWVLSPIVSGSRYLRHHSYDVDVPTSHIGSGDRAGAQDKL